MNKISFSTYITEHLDKPFKWGENDCVLFSVGWLEKKSGKDFLSKYVNWKSKRQAIKAIKEYGGLESKFDEYFTKVDPRLARDGAITIIKDAGYTFPFCGVFSGRYILAIGENGVEFIDRGKATCAWDYL